MNVADILNRAADLIEERGLFKGMYEGPDGSLCTGGAMLCAAGIRQDWSVPRWELYDAARAAVRSQIGQDHIARWNDEPGRTKEEVVAALRTAAVTSRREGTPDAH